MGIGPTPHFFVHMENNTLTENIALLEEDPIYMDLAMKWEENTDDIIFLEKCDVCSQLQDILQIVFTHNMFRCSHCFTHN